MGRKKGERKGGIGKGEGSVRTEKRERESGCEGRSEEGRERGNVKFERRKRARRVGE